MKVTIDVNLEKIYDEGFEEVIAASLVKKLGKEFREKASDLITEKTGVLMVAAVNRAVEVKLSSLMDEPVVMTDRYGAKKFLGSVEDYIKQEIDNRLLRPVDSNGRALTGSCSNSDAKTWLEWKFEDVSNKAIDIAVKKFEQTAKDKIGVIVSEKTNAIIAEKSKAAISSVIAGIIKG